ncbi:MAG: hypothetical protein O2944_08155 [Proteobacteria bacterium]|nr:hypothetical protein [Pseudomonadota bacterium]
MLVNVGEQMMTPATPLAVRPRVADKSTDRRVRPWPPVMIRDFLRVHSSEAIHVSPDLRVGSIIDFLAGSMTAVVTVTDCHGNLVGTVVDDDVMAAIGEHGVQVLDWPISDVLTLGRPICNISDSPYIVLHDMLASDQRRFAVRERGMIVGVVVRDHLLEFAGT